MSCDGEGKCLIQVLVVFQFAVTLVLLSGAGIFVHSLLQNLFANRPVPADQLMTARIDKRLDIISHGGQVADESDSFTPGSWRSCCSSLVLKESICACVAYGFGGNAYAAVVTWSGRKPRSTAFMLLKFRSKPDDESSTKATAIPMTTKVERRRAWPPLTEPLRPPSFRVLQLVQVARHFGVNLVSNRADCAGLDGSPLLSRRI
jgi:hypothetical protein